MKKIKASFLSLKNKYFYKLLLIICVLIVFTIGIASISYIRTYKNDYDESNKNEYEEEIHNINTYLNSSISNLSNTSAMLTYNESFYNIIFNLPYIEVEDYYEIREVVNVIGYFSLSNSIIKNAYISAPLSDTIITSKGTDEFDNFYNNANTYKEYPIDFWQDYNDNPASERIYKSTNVNSYRSNTHETYNVMPYVINKFNNIKTYNYLVIELDTNEIFKEIEHFMPTENTLLNVYKDDEIYLSNGSINDNDKYIVNSMDYMINGDTYTYELSTLEDEYYSSYYGFRNYFVILIILLIISIISITYYFAFKLYSPIGKIYSLLHNTSDSTVKSEIEYINQKLMEIISKKDLAEETLLAVTPLASEQFLFKIVTDNDYYLKDSTKNKLLNDFFKFEYDNFFVLTCKLDFSKDYMSSRDKKDLTNNISELYNILQNMSIGQSQTFVFNRNMLSISLLINTSDAVNLNIVKGYVDNYLDLFKYDKEIVSVKIGIGNMYKDLYKINNSYREAHAAISKIKGFTTEAMIYSQIQLFPSLDDLANLKELLLNDMNKSIPFFEKLKRNKNYIIDEDFYLNVFNVILEVYIEKNLNRDKLIFIKNLENREYDNLIVNSILNINRTQSEKLSIDEVVEYINNNFNKDISLSDLADEFGVNSKYISKFFKENLGIGFKEYLLTIRVAKAKHLLSDTDMSVTNIGKECGFLSHSTFFRVFKNQEGINPSQYRQNMEK